MNHKISIIAAIGKNRELGLNNKLLWHIPEDLARFKKITNGHPVIMGRKTFESIGMLLPGRTNIIVTRDKTFSLPGCTITHSLEDAIKIAKKPAAGEIFVIGGGQIYKEAIKYADKLYLTVVEGTFTADTYFPNYSAFKKIIFEEKHQNKRYTFTFFEIVK